MADYRRSSKWGKRTEKVSFRLTPEELEELEELVPEGLSRSEWLRKRVLSDTR